MALAKPYVPVELNAAERAFPAKVAHLMPEPEDIPTNFTYYDGDSEWIEFANKWFAGRLPEATVFSPKDGFTANVAYNHVNAIMRSYEPKHERKIEAVAYLSSLWFQVVAEVVDPEEQTIRVLYGVVPEGDEVHIHDESEEVED